MSSFKAFIDDECGATAIEYGLIAALVSVAATIALGSIGDSLNDTFVDVNNGVTLPGGGGGGGSIE